MPLDGAAAEAETQPRLAAGQAAAKAANVQATGGPGDAQMDLFDLLQIIWAHRLAVLVSMLVALGAALAYLHLATPLYTGELKVTPSNNAVAPSATSLGNLGGLASMAGLTSSGGEPTKFDLFLEMLTTREVADQLAADPKILRTVFEGEWDEQSRRWRKPESTVADLRRLLGQLAGERQLPWEPPSGERLQQHIIKNLKITRSTQKNPVTYIRYDARDPRFAEYLLHRLSRTADHTVRRRVLREGREYISYLESRLPNVVAPDQREALVEILGEQERRLMMASSGVPFAASVIERPLAPRTPSKPRVPVVLAVALIIGTVAGAGLTLLRRKQAG